ncbi:Probable hydroxyacid-oxoacid transhydrogenase, mitochondrial [Geodia barretti]|uniref:hydroxyacid-oxoacid transhydrogenase n=2 Tax=Geodia barretti TaxID=519541 RepID=A0AA35SXW1_GEOBA|nr:Probable hydroxyacid-oxoacid transhydrogenase, mitochondrial [Geodia barretti]
MIGPVPRRTAFERIVTLDAANIKFGPGATGETGFEARRLGLLRVMVLTDPRLRDGPQVAAVQASLGGAGIDATVYDRVRVEPTDRSFREAIQEADRGQYDGFVAVGGGSVIDTAKAANLYHTYPADFLDYVNHPVGRGRPVPGPLKPLIAVPTTAGTGSETTGVAIFDLEGLHAKTGIAHRALKPTVGIVDPDNTRSMPPLAAACTGLDVLSHAIESYTALPYTQRPAPDDPSLRPAYQGSNPMSDVWSARAIEMVAANLPAAIAGDTEPQAQMLLAATFAGIGFGNAGCHLPHGMSYPVSSNVRDFHPEGYPDDHPMIPHGMSVILNAPAVFRWTAPAEPQRHLQAAALMGADVSGVGPDDAGEATANAIIDLMRRTGMPNGLSGVGYTPADIDVLVRGTLPQHRVTKLSPRPFDEADLRGMFESAMRYW